MILEGAMVAIASIALTAAHPGLIFGSFWKMLKAREAARNSSPSGAVANGKDGFVMQTREETESTKDQNAQGYKRF